MNFDIDELIFHIDEYRQADEEALYEIIKNHSPYDRGGKYDYNIGLAHMNEDGVGTADGEELKGRIESFGAVLEFINRMKNCRV